MSSFSWQATVRLANGIARTDFRQAFTVEPEALLDGERLQQLESAGLISLDDMRLTATNAGLTRLNGLLAYLLG